MAAKDNLGGQWDSPGERPAPISKDEHELNMTTIYYELTKHPKNVSIGLIGQGMQHLGHDNSRNGWARLADLAKSDPEAFHSTVGDLRRAGITKRQQVSADRNARRALNRQRKNPNGGTPKENPH